MEKTRFVKPAEFESKKEKPTYDSDETVSAEEVELNLTSPEIISTQIAKLENKAKPKSDDFSKWKDIISISSDSEHENAEQNIEMLCCGNQDRQRNAVSPFQKKY